MNSISLQTKIETWTYAEPLQITGLLKKAVNNVTVTLEQEGSVGRGEASGVRYRGEDAATIVEQIESIRPAVEKGITRVALQELLPPGGARHGLDAALWDLEAKRSGVPVWDAAGIGPPRPVKTVFTCGADAPDAMVRRALSFEGACALKLKLTGDPIDADRVMAVRAALPSIWLSIDANQGYRDRATFEELLPILIKADVAMIEQPFPVGQEALLEGLQSPIPIAADESVQCLADIPSLVGRFDMINIKLDKCGGLTEGLLMARAARERGLNVMVGHFGGTSLAMAPGFILGQLCDIADLDGPALLKSDRPNPATYSNGCIWCPEELWGAPSLGGSKDNFPLERPE